MSTQAYYPQPQQPPPPARTGKLSLAMGLPEIIAIESMPGETAQSNFGGPEVKFRLTDGRIWYVPPVVADFIYANVVPRQQFEAVRIGRGKHEIRIVPLPAHLGSPNGAGAHANAPVPNSSTSNYTSHNPTASVPPAAPSAMTPAATCMCAAMMAAVDAVIETQAYATRKGLGLTFGEESVRAIGLSIYIDACRNGGAR